MSGGCVGTDRPRLFGVMSTYRRPGVALAHLDVLDRQTLRPEFVVVVDNGGERVLEARLTERPSDGVSTRYVDPGSNVGPAGAFRAGLDVVRPLAGPDDLLVHLDDDDPPVDDTQLESLVELLVARRAADPRVGAVGLSGGRLDTRTGLVRPTRGLAPYEDVDHLHGGYLPVFTIEALIDTGGNDPSFFYGFEELELGRRIHLAGFRQLVHTDLSHDVLDRYPKKAPGAAAQRQVAEGEWSRFHKERNLVRILRREGRWPAIVFTVGARHVVIPVLRMLREPRIGWRRLVIGMRASWAGLRDRGGIDPRYPPPV